jgi:hypothetical protein
MVVLGIDPGIQGGIAIIAINDAVPTLVGAWDISVLVLAPKNGSTCSPCAL